MCKGELVDLILNRLGDGLITVTQARHGCTAGSIQILFSIGIDQIAPIAANRGWQFRMAMTWKDMRQKFIPFGGQQDFLVRCKDQVGCFFANHDGRGVGVA